MSALLLSNEFGMMSKQPAKSTNHSDIECLKVELVATKRASTSPAPAPPPPSKRQKVAPQPHRPAASSDPVPDADVYATIVSALADNAKRFDESGNVIPGPLRTGMTFDYIKKDANGERTIQEHVTGWPSGWGKGGAGKNLLVYKNPDLQGGPHVYVVVYMSNASTFQ
jgi:hypothetical protein